MLPFSCVHLINLLSLLIIVQLWCFRRSGTTERSSFLSSHVLSSFRSVWPLLQNLLSLSFCFIRLFIYSSIVCSSLSFLQSCCPFCTFYAIFYIILFNCSASLDVRASGERVCACAAPPHTQRTTHSTGLVYLLHYLGKVAFANMNA